MSLKDWLVPGKDEFKKADPLLYGAGKGLMRAEDKLLSKSWDVLGGDKMADFHGDDANNSTDALNHRLAGGALYLGGSALMGGAGSFLGSGGSAAGAGAGTSGGPQMMRQMPKMPGMGGGGMGGGQPQQEQSMGMSPEMMQAILQGQGGESDPRTQQLQQQQQMINMMRKQAMQGSGGHQMAGRVAIPQTGTALANVFGAYKAGQAQPGVTAGMQEQSAMQGEQRKQYMQALIAAMRGAAPQGAPQGMMSPQNPPMASGGY
jgi:hypothetical protein